MFQLGTLKQDRGSRNIPVVVEEMTIHFKHAQVEYSGRLFERLENVLSLGTTDAITDFRALNCCEVIGLTYKYHPSVSGNSRSTMVVSLAQLLAQHRTIVDDEQNLVIDIDDRVQLVRDLALAVSNFHHIGWMHKNISSHMVLFFYDDVPPSGAPKEPRPPPPTPEPVGARPHRLLAQP